MTDKQVVKKVMKIRKWSQQKLADEAGFKAQANVTGIINTGKNSMRVDKLVKMLSAMGYELVVRDKMGDRDEFLIDMVDREVDLDALLGDD